MIMLVLIIQGKQQQLNIMENSFTSKYLAGISSNLLKSISIDCSLEDIIENNKGIFINYNKDSMYTNSSKYNPPSDKIYLKTLSHKNMTDEREGYLGEPIDTVRAYCKIMVIKSLTSMKKNVT